MSLAHDLVRGRYSPAKAGLTRGKLWVSIKGNRKPSTRGRSNPEKQSNQPRKTEQTRHNQKKYRVKNGNINPKQSKKPKKRGHKPKNIYTKRRERQRGVTDQPCFRPCKKTIDH
jgi:hypothetical protein